MSDIKDLAQKYGEEMYQLGRKHEALEIKAEIEKMRSKQNCSCSDCLDIIDKHIKENKQ